MKTPRFKYHAFDHAVIRTPLFPLGALHLCDTYIGSKEFKEAVYLASPAMFRAQETAARDDGKQAKADNSIYKYFSRCTTRCTPFGLFAGCSTVPVGSEQTAITLSGIRQYKRRTRPDMQYLCALIRQLENDPQIRPLLRFYPNDSLYPLAGHLRYVEYHYRNTRRVHQISAVEQSDYLQYVLDAAIKGLRPDELAQLLTDEEITAEEALNFIYELIDSQLLKSELDPAVIGEDALSVLINKLEDLSDVSILKPLKEIQQLLNELDETSLGDNLSLYEEIITRIKSLGIQYEEKYLFQTDMYKPVLHGGLAHQLVDEVNEALIFLSRLHTVYQNQNLLKFKEKFFERFEYREVPLTMALDSELGVGYPVKTSSNDVNTLVDDLPVAFRNTGESNLTVSAIDLVLLKKYVEAIQTDQKRIWVTESDFNLTSPPDSAYPDTLTVIGSVVQQTDGQPLVFIKSAGGDGATLLGRFCHLDESIETLVRQIAAFEKDHNPDKVLAELSHLPESRVGNIVSRPLFRDVILHYLSNTDQSNGQAVNLSELLLSIKNDRLFLRSKKEDREIVPKLTCAHNFSGSAIPAYRFLCDMQTQDPRVGFYLDWGNIFRTFDYVPRIQYKNVILSRQRWTITKKELDGCAGLPDCELLEFFDSFATRRRMNSRIVIPEGDNEMHIDLTLVRSIRLMLELVKRKERFEVYEYLFSEYESVATSGQGDSYANEVVLTFHK